MARVVLSREVRDQVCLIFGWGPDAGQPPIFVDAGKRRQEERTPSARPFAETGVHTHKNVHMSLHKCTCTHCANPLCTQRSRTWS